MEKTAIRHSAELTVMAKKVFGDIVNKAFVTTWDICSDKDEVMSRIEAEARGLSGDNIDIGATTLWIMFKNGKFVEFQSSEWGTIGSADTDNSYEL